MKSTTFIFISLMLVLSCKKSDTNTFTGNITEISDVRTGGAVKSVSLEFLPGSQIATAITLKNQSSGFSGNIHVTLALDSAAVTAAGFNKLRAGDFSMTTLEYDIPANGSVAVPITINRSSLNVDSAYALAFKIVSADTGAIAADAKTIIVKFDMCNRLDGHYRETGSGVFTNPNDTLFKFIEFEMNLVTTSPTQVKMISKQIGIEAYVMGTGNIVTWWGNFGPVFDFNATNNKITSVTNYYGQPASNTRSAEMDPSGINQWNSGTRNIDVKFWMNQSNYNLTAPYHRILYTNTFVYLAPRVQ